MGGTDETLSGDLRVARGYRVCPATASAARHDRPAARAPAAAAEVTLVLELAAEEVLPAICVRAAEQRLTPRDLVQLELLRKGLDGTAPPRAWQETG